MAPTAATAAAGGNETHRPSSPGSGASSRGGVMTDDGAPTTATSHYSSNKEKRARTITASSKKNVLARCVAPILFVGSALHLYAMGRVLGPSIAPSSSSSYASYDYWNTMKRVRLLGGFNSHEDAARTHQQLPIDTIAYAVSLTSCGKTLRGTTYDAASVLKRSIELSSYPLHSTSRYASTFYALVLSGHERSPCAAMLEQAGYQILVRSSPVSVEEIAQPEGSVLKNDIGRDGCCGINELIKLHAYGLTNHTIAVHLDLDALVLRPFDELFDAMTFPPPPLSSGGDSPGDDGRGSVGIFTTAGSTADATVGEEGARAREVLKASVAPTYKPIVPLEQMTFDAFYTKDYNMIKTIHQHRVGMQGGFFVVRTNTTRLTELSDMVKSGEFYPGRDAKTSGWFRSGYGRHIWGSLTIQGLLAYYYDLVRGESSVELNRCRYNQIADNPRRSSFDRMGKFPRGTPLPTSNVTYRDTTCRDGRANCDDVQCQTWPIIDTRLVHYTYCKVPWNCNDCSYFETYVQPKCYEMHREWFRVRSTLDEENVRGDDGGTGDGGGGGDLGGADPGGAFCKEYALGYCKGGGIENYVPLERIDRRVGG